jgi:predicted nuclease of restriction endonuclease-like (RecB) superfamily
MNYELVNFAIPSYKELNDMSKYERLNSYRRFFAHSRYNRLIIQLFMINYASNDSLSSVVANLQNQNLLGFDKTIKYIKNSPYFLEFLEALKEEEEALIKIIDAYNNKIDPNFAKTR